ncbi:MAG: cation:dicarboxylase symporter family transporter [Spirochaetaceae bacterium]|jgi:Na+/H+-dicarboxylate symporter|nr:cation:dicarboxylase symporter family transporter [Spirochaetaceae bacterium]
MKVWIKFLVGSVLGLVLGFLLPQDNQFIMEWLAWIEALAIRIGRYAAVPVLFFSMVIGMYELRQEGRFWRVAARSFLMMLVISVFVIAMGIAATLIFPPGRIPILIEEQVETVSVSIPESIMELFPSNMFMALITDGVYLFPAYICAFFVGVGLSCDRTYSKQVVSLVDSLSRVFYHIVSLFSEILFPVLIAISAYWAVQYRGVSQSGTFRDLILLLGVFSVILTFGVFPLFLYFLRPKINPWAVLYGSLGPGIAAFFSGDINFTLPVLLRNVKENLGVRRRANAVCLPLFASFGRAGSAMVAAAAFIVIIKSYSSLGITIADAAAIGLRAVLISFLLARHPGDGAYTALALLSLGYSRDFEAGYLNLKPLAFYLIAIGTFLDVMISSFSTFALAKLSGFQEEKSIRHFI